MAVEEQERDNMVRWDGKRFPFFEVYYLKFYAGPGNAYWIRFVILAPERELGPPSVSVAAMCFTGQPGSNIAVKETFNAEPAVFDRDIFFLEVGENAVYNNGSRGRVTSGGHSIAWDLQYIPNETTHRIYPRSFYHLPFPETKFLSPNWSIRFSGTVEVDGLRLPLSGAPGCQTHFWGPHHTERWAWGHCNTFREDPDAVFEALSGQSRFGKKLFRPLSALTLRLGGGPTMTFNRLSQLFLNQSRYDLQSWILEGHRGHYRIKARLLNRPVDSMGITLADTDGSMLYCYHAETADLVVELYEERRNSHKLLTSLNSQGGASYEIVERSPIQDLPLPL